MNPEAKKRYKDIDFPFTCPITNRDFNSPQGLSCYVTKTLKIDHQSYYDEYVNHRDNKCFFCGNKGKFISISKGYRNLCDSKDCMKLSFNSHSVEGIMYRKFVGREEAELIFEKENKRQLKERIKTQKKLRKKDPLWDKKRSRNCKEFWIEKGHSEEEAVNISKEVMNEIHKKTSHKLKSNPKKYAYKYPTKVEYYLKKGYTESEAKKQISKIQNRFSKEICIQKYGDKRGIEIWLKRQVKWQNTLNKNGNMKSGYSKISQELFNKILNNYSSDISNVFFHNKNNEYLIKSEKSIYLYDFTDIKKMKMIEYNGDQYHANPSIYESNDMPHPYHKTKKFTASEIWKRDKEKKSAANKLGFDVLTIWDSEYRKYPEETLKKCLSFLDETI